VLNSTLNPLTQVHDSLWEMLESSEAWCELVEPGNRIKFSGRGVSPRKDQALEADRPEVQIRAITVDSFLNADSSNTKIIAAFEIQIATSQQGFDASLFPVLWETIKALHLYRSFLMALTWEEIPFVKRVQGRPGQIGVGQGDAAKGMLWWGCLWACEVEMWLPAAYLTPTV